MALQDQGSTRAVRAGSAEQPFTGPLARLDRLARVAPGTVVVVQRLGRPPAVRRPGELLIPPLMPFGAELTALPVGTGVVALQVGVADLLTLDGRSVPAVRLRLPVQVDEADGYARLARLAVDRGPDLGGYLMEQVQAAVERHVRAAFRMNGLSDLRRLGVEQVLSARWLPHEFAGGVLLRRGLAVTAVDWPQPEPPPAAVRPAAAVPEPALDLTLESRLRRVWQRHTGSRPVGIAAAQAGGRAAVVAVAAGAPGAYEVSRVREVLGELLADRQLSLVVLTVAEVADYASLVTAWVGRLTGGTAVRVQVEPLGETDRLRVWLDWLPGEPAASTARRLVSDSAEVEALRRLLPHRRVEMINRQRR